MRDAIGPTGFISFARFMELALYCPLYGFYEQERDTIGRRGDYCTSVSVGSLFGELLGFQFAEWLLEAGRQSAGHGTKEEGGPPRCIVEAGAHDGRLAADILAWTRTYRPELFASMEYWIVEPSPRRQQWQARTLKEFASRVRWLSRLPAWSDPQAGVRGVVFCNELLDAMPVHRLGWDARHQVWFEWGVGTHGEDFAWVKMPGRIEANADSLQARFRLAVSPFDLQPALLAVLPDGFTIEVSPAALKWWQDASRALGQGKLLSIDYGLSADEFLTPGMAAGTLRAYRRHQICTDVLAHVGAQDLSAHVNFTALQAVGEGAGLRTEGRMTQAEFLTRIVGETEKKKDKFGQWTSRRVRQFQTLTHPDHLGRAFQLLIQSRGCSSGPAG